MPLVTSTDTGQLAETPFPGCPIHSPNNLFVEFLRMFFVWGLGLAQALSWNYFAAEVNAIFFPPFMFSDHGLTPLVSVLDVDEWAFPHRPDACVCVCGSGPWPFACLWDNQSGSCFKILI